MEEIKLRCANKEDIKIISTLIKNYHLDDNNLNSNDFIIAEINNEIVGFGRIRDYEEFIELASVGVIEKYRNCGIGKLLIESLLSKNNVDEIWITTKISEFFRKFGFKKSYTPPEKIRKKFNQLSLRVHGAIVETEFMIMKKYEKNSICLYKRKQISLKKNYPLANKKAG